MFEAILQQIVHEKEVTITLDVILLFEVKFLVLKCTTHVIGKSPNLFQSAFRDLFFFLFILF